MAIANPTTSLRWVVGDTVSFSGSATDNQGAEIPVLEPDLEARAQARACPDCHDHFLQTYSGVSSGSFNAPTTTIPPSSSSPSRRPTPPVSRNSTSIRLLPRTTTLTFQTNPTGLKLTFNGVNATAPFSPRV